MQICSLWMGGRAVDGGEEGICRWTGASLLQIFRHGSSGGGYGCEVVGRKGLDWLVWDFLMSVGEFAAMQLVS